MSGRRRTVSSRCTRCGEAVERVEADHPDGRTRPWWARRRAAMPVYPEVTVDLCVRCHSGKGIVDRGAGVEGAETASVWLLLARRSAWAGWLGLSGRPITLVSRHLSDLARVLQDTARTVGVCSLVLAWVAKELHRRQLHELASVVAGVAFLLGRRVR